MLSFYKFKLSNTNLRKQNFLSIAFHSKECLLYYQQYILIFMRKWLSVWPKDVDLNFFFILISVRSTRIVHKYLCYSKIHVLLICHNLCRSFMLFDYNIFWSERDNTNIKRISKHFKFTWTLLMHTCCAKPFVFNKKHANKISWQLLVLSNFHQIGINTL